jgi:hypothetical protein
MRKVKYKVIKKHNRVSAIVDGNSKYAIEYTPNQDVYALENTDGIFVFTVKRAAERWIYNERTRYLYPDLTIIRVIPIGRGKTLCYVSSDMSSRGLDSYYMHGFLHAFPANPPSNTMVYPGVHVLN